MKRIVLALLLVLSVITITAQNISVKSFRALPMDMTASSLEGKRIDQNGEVAALIKVVTNETGYVFEGGALGIVDSQQRIGEIWVWVPRGLRKITILHQQLGVLRDYMFPVAIEVERTYEMVLTTAKIETIVKEEIKQQYLAFEITPPNATLEVDDQLWTVSAEGTAVQFVDFGTYSYRVRAANYFTEAGKVTVDDPNNAKKVKIVLTPDCAEITLKVDADAEIYVNNEKKGVRTWTGLLGKGTYKIECRLSGCETAETTVNITNEMSGQTITLPVPKPIYGSLNVESIPFATLYIDGKESGTTPKFINEILVGTHELIFRKEGYLDHTETVVVKKGERAQVKAVLTEGVEVIDPVVGVFSIGTWKKVNISKGNLQYQASTRTWRFAEHQWDCIGKENKKISQTNSDWIDMFCWGTGDSPTRTEGMFDHSVYKTFIDWGNNKILNETGRWRTLSADEWVFLFNNRYTESGVRYAKAVVNDINGVILVPDDWDVSYYPLKEANNQKASFKSNVISASNWTNKLEAHGAVFLPAAGARSAKTVGSVNSIGYYWSSTPVQKEFAYYLYIRDSKLDPIHMQIGRGNGASVRLVREINQ